MKRCDLREMNRNSTCHTRLEWRLDSWHVVRSTGEDFQVPDFGFSLSQFEIFATQQQQKHQKPICNETRDTLGAVPVN